MRKITLIALMIMARTLTAGAQTTPDITSWILNTTGATGYAGIETNVQLVQYDDSFVYVSATCIPGYSIGPWVGSPAIPSNQNFVFRIPRFPVPNTGTPTVIAGGHEGTLTNGVSAFGATDAHTYNNLNVWQQNGYHFEYPSFDACLGHPQQFGEYHHHVSPKCLYSITDSTHHSPIIGYAYDGYPIYGAYGYTDTSATGGTVKRMKSGFVLRSMVNRDTLPDGTVLTPTYYGPPVSDSFPLGSYIQDYQFVTGYGDLDVHNGRWCHTPEYPAGTYAYFTTLDSNSNPAYPYILGQSYYGIADKSDLDSATWHNSGHYVITDSVTTYTTATAQILANKFSIDIFPNPASDFIHIFIQPIAANNFTATLADETGRNVLSQKNLQPSITYTLDVSTLPTGIYILSVKNGTIAYAEKIVITR